MLKVSRPPSPGSICTCGGAVVAIKRAPPVGDERPEPQGKRQKAKGKGQKGGTVLHFCLLPFAFCLPPSRYASSSRSFRGIVPSQGISFPIVRHQYQPQIPVSIEENPEH